MKTLIDRTQWVIGVGCRAVLFLTLAVMFLILTANVGLRYALGTSLSWASELPELLFPWLIMAGVVLGAQHGSHIAVVILTQKLGASRRWVLATGSLLVACMYLGLCVAAWPLYEISADEYTPMLGVPGSLTVACLMGGFVLLALTALLQLPEIFRAPVAQPNDDAVAASEASA